MSKVEVTHTFSPGKLAQFAELISSKAGFEPQDARILAECLVDAELRGIASHGLVHLPMHIEELERGLLNPKSEPKAVKDSGGVVVLDGNFGLGQTLTIHAMDIAIDRARQFGIASVGVRNSGSFGAAGYYPLRAAAKGMIGFALQNTAPHLAPPGAIDKLIGNNPFAIALPTQDMPVLLDIACSSTARASLIMAAKKKEKIPLDWAIDSDGHPTDDPEKALLGALLPFAGHKGYGLAFVLGLLSGPLLGLDDSTYTHTMYFPRPKGFGIIVIAIDISHFVELSVFQSGVEEWIGRLRSARLTSNKERLRFPGERSHELKNVHTKRGITLPQAVIDDLKQLAERFSCEMPGPLNARSHQ